MNKVVLGFAIGHLSASGIIGSNWEEGEPLRLVTASAPTMKRVNRATILTVLKNTNGIPRSQIAALTGLTKATVTNLVGELIEEGLAQEEAKSRSTGGRRPIPIVLNPYAKFVLGVDVGIHELRVAAVDLKSRVIDKWTYPVRHVAGPGHFLQILEDVIKRSVETLTGSNNLWSHDKWLGVGIGMHGLVDSTQGTAVFAPHFDLHEVKICDYLHERCKVPVALTNDVRAMAYGELSTLMSEQLSNLIFVNVGIGVGAAIVLHGQLLEGVAGIAGEIGHNVVEPGGRRCACGRYGCLETVCSGPAIAERAIEGVRGGRSSVISDLVQGDLSQVTAHTVFQAAELGDAVAQDVFRAAGRHLGQSLGYLVNALDPHLVIIGGGVSLAGVHLFSPLQEQFDRVVMERIRAHVKVTSSHLADATQIGAASLILNRMFSPDFSYRVSP